MSPRRHASARAARRRDGGVAIVEMLMLAPILVLVAMVVTQVALIALARSAAQDAALAAARSAELGRDPGTAATQAVGSWLRPVSVEAVGDGHTMRVHVTVPKVVPFVDLGVDVNRTAVLP